MWHDIGIGVGQRRASQGASISVSNVLKFGALGDSIVRQGQFDWGAAVTKWLPNEYDWALGAARLSGRRFWVDPAAVEGYSGQQSSSILTSMLPTSATTSFGPAGKKVNIPYGVKSVAPDYCFEISGTNDLTAHAGGDPAVAVAERRAIWTELRANGIEPIALSLLPRTDAYAADVATWNAAYKAQADADGVTWIDIYTTCATGSAWNTGYNWHNGATDNLHPGADGCRAISAAIVAALTQSNVLHPTLTTDGVEIEKGSKVTLLDNPSSAWDGLVANVANWPARFEPTYTSTRAAISDAVAVEGNALQIQFAAQAGTFYSDTQSPEIAVVAGNKYAVLCRLAYTSGQARPIPGDTPDNFALNVVDAATYQGLVGFTDGNNGSYSITGASIPNGDYYQEFYIPENVENIRIFLANNTDPASVGSQLKIAQMAIIGPI